MDLSFNKCPHDANAKMYRRCKRCGVAVAIVENGVTTVLKNAYNQGICNDCKQQERNRWRITE